MAILCGLIYDNDASAGLTASWRGCRRTSCLAQREIKISAASLLLGDIGAYLFCIFSRARYLDIENIIIVIAARRLLCVVAFLLYMRETAAHETLSWLVAAVP